jgi:hypothetical protein
MSGSIGSIIALICARFIRYEAAFSNLSFATEAATTRSDAKR